MINFNLILFASFDKYSYNEFKKTADKKIEITSGGKRMPEISLFYGIRITMYYDDHNPPHFHVEYNGKKALIDIVEACVIKGSLPSRQLKLVLAWCVIHQDELMQNWELAKDGKPLNRINPLV